MSLHKAKPTSAGRRFVVEVKTDGLYKGKPYEALVDKKSSKGGRNNNGRITVRHRGGGHKQRYSIVAFKRNKQGIPGVVEPLEYDPNRSAHLALIKYSDGERRYILAPRGVAAGTPVNLIEVDPETINLYGCASVTPTRAQDVVRVDDLVEKPDPAEAPSNLAIIGRYVLDPAVFDVLARTAPVLRAWDRTFLQVGVEGQRFDHLRRVHRHVAVGVEGPGVVGDRHLLEDLVTEAEALAG